MLAIAICLASVHYFVGLHMYMAQYAKYFLGTYTGNIPGSVVAEFVYYIVFFFIGVWGLTIVAGSSEK